MSDEAVLKWSSYPFKKNKLISFMVIGFLIFVSVLVYLITISLIFFFLAVIILFFSMASFFFPTHYELTKDKIKVKFLLTKSIKPWENYKSYYPDKNGVFLSPFLTPSRLENFRGIYLRYNSNNQKEVLNFVKARFSSNP